MLPSRREGEGLIYSGGEEKIRIASVAFFYPFSSDQMIINLSMI